MQFPLDLWATTTLANGGDFLHSGNALTAVFTASGPVKKLKVFESCSIEYVQNAVGFVPGVIRQ